MFSFLFHAPPIHELSPSKTAASSSQGEGLLPQIQEKKEKTQAEPHGLSLSLNASQELVPQLIIVPEA